MKKSCSDNRRSSAECLAIGFSLYTAITFQNNLTEAKTCERINNVSSVTQYATNSCLISWPARLANKILGATDFSCAVSGFGSSREVKYFCHRCSPKLVAKNSNAASHMNTSKFLRTKE